jgi:putative glutamine amidotransferase
MQPTICIFGNGSYANYCDALRRAGAVPVVTGDCAEAQRCDGLLLPGGDDIPGDLEPGERRTIQFFLDAGRPILGICRGMQALNVFFGGTLYQDIPGHRIGTGGEGDMIHPTDADGLIAELLGDHPAVNSNHHQAVERLGDGLVICQRTADGIAEAFCRHDVPIWGVQWHPERQSFSRKRPDAVDAAPIFLHFVDQVRSCLCRTSGN